MGHPRHFFVAAIADGDHDGVGVHDELFAGGHGTPAAGLVRLAKLHPSEADGTYLPVRPGVEAQRGGEIFEAHSFFHGVYAFLNAALLFGLGAPVGAGHFL